MRELFLLDPDVVFLNHGSFGACPRPVFDEYQRLQLELEREPVEFLSLKRRFPELIGTARARIAAYVGASTADVVLVPNATAAVNAVARSLDLQPGDEVVATTHEYGGNDLLWRYVCEQRGARYVEVDTAPKRAVDDLLGPLLEPRAVSWDWPAAEWAERHRWAGTYDPSPHLAVPAAIDFQAEYGWETVRARCHGLASQAVKELSEQLGTEPLATSDDEFVQMATVRLPPCDADELCLRLYRERRIEVLAQPWRGEPTLRVSFQGYNDENDLEVLQAALRDLL